MRWEAGWGSSGKEAAWGDAGEGESGVTSPGPDTHLVNGSGQGIHSFWPLLSNRALGGQTIDHPGHSTGIPANPCPPPPYPGPDPTTGPGPVSPFPDPSLAGFDIPTNPRPRPDQTHGSGKLPHVLTPALIPPIPVTRPTSPPIPESGTTTGRAGRKQTRTRRERARTEWARSQECADNPINWPPKQL